MRRDTATKGWSRFQSSLPACDHIHHFKRSKKSSSTKLMNIMYIDDLPDVVLAEILCRLASNKLVVQYRCVSKRWCTLISDPYFIGRFLRLQMDKRTLRTSTLINPKGEEILTRIWSPVFKRLMTVHGLKKEPVVVGTYNDLVLCCASEHHQRDYYICNPYTRQWVALPPTPTQSENTVGVGFICDIPYFNHNEDDDRKGLYNIVQVNAEYRCKVVRFVPSEEYNKKNNSFKFHVELFSFETGEWKESVISSPLSYHSMAGNQSFAYNGMLYWVDMDGRIFELDPFMMNNITCTSKGDDIIGCCKSRIVNDLADSVDGGTVVLEFVGVCRGWLRVCDFDQSTLYVWELKEERDHDGTGKFHLKDMREYSLDENMIPDDYRLAVEILHFDPNNEDILYLYIDGDIVRCDIRTRKWSKLAAGKTKTEVSDKLFPLVLPWWPTPVPRLPQHASPSHDQQAHGGGTSS